MPGPRKWLPSAAFPSSGPGGQGLGGSAAAGGSRLAWTWWGGLSSPRCSEAAVGGAVIPPGSQELLLASGGVRGEWSRGVLCCLLKSAMGKTALAFPRWPWRPSLQRWAGCGTRGCRAQGERHLRAPGRHVWDLVCWSWGSFCCCCKGLEASMGETPLLGFLTTSLKALTLPGGAVRAGVTRAGVY